ncbi:hypothetical protein HPP92_018018 [Vanilla planifolia]|uniref:Uncharacterized protein n=1 Tax=Vanilla planifolia TaxID=51239 RepID=A0A835Q811_VANPL|nr:hypothetical protein HPP92_018018 [Vanilla planifolia]
MKGYAAVTSAAKQRRWKCLVVFVLLLVFFSILVPLVFFLSLRRLFRWCVGYFSDERLPAVRIIDVLMHHPLASFAMVSYTRLLELILFDFVQQDSRAEQMLRSFTPSLTQRSCSEHIRSTTLMPTIAAPNI